MGAQFALKLLWHGNGPGTKLNMESCNQISKGVTSGCERRPKSTILEHFWGILKSLKEVKVTIDVETKKIFELNI